MSKVEKITAPNGPRAPAIAVKLDAAREHLRSVRSQIAQTVLDVEDALPGADADLADLRASIAASEQKVDELTKAHELARTLDRRADAAGAAAMRSEQLAFMRKHAAVRLKAVASLMDSIAKASEAYGEYVLATNQMTVALPTGARMGFIALGRNGYGGPWLGDLKALIATEAWRLLPALPGGEKRLPFAVAPELSSGDHTKLPPAIELMTDAQNAVLRDIESQVERLNAESMAQATGAAA